MTPAGSPDERPALRGSRVHWLHRRRVRLCGKDGRAQYLRGEKARRSRICVPQSLYMIDRMAIILATSERESALRGIDCAASASSVASDNPSHPDRASSRYRR